MLKEVITSAESVELAFENACKELGYEQSDVQMEILEEATKKTFGLFGGNPAKVRAYIDITPEFKAVKYLEKIFTAMDVNDLEIDVTKDDDGITIKLNASEISFIIGHRGDTLDSLQYLTSLVANQGEEKYARVSIDVGTFRTKRKETLESLGKKIAIKAVKYGKNQVLEAMNPYERRIIHFAVQSVEGAKSWSEGEDLTRHVVIGPVDGERKFTPRNNNNRFNNDRNNDRRNPRNGGNQRRDNRNFDKRNDRDSSQNQEFRNKVKQAITYDAPVEDFKPSGLDSDIIRKKEADAPLYGRIK